MDAGDMQRAIWRIAHEIVERNHGLGGVVLIGLQTGGVPLAFKLAETLAQIERQTPRRAPLDRFAGFGAELFPSGLHHSPGADLREAGTGPPTGSDAGAEPDTAADEAPAA